MKQTAALLSDIAQTDETLQAAHHAARPMLPAMLFCLRITSKFITFAFESDGSGSQKQSAKLFTTSNKHSKTKKKQITCIGYYS